MSDTPQDPKPFKVHIGWGEAPEEGFTSDLYEFATQAELDAFMEGVEAAEGRMAYEVFDSPHEWDVERGQWFDPQKRCVWCKGTGVESIEPGHEEQDCHTCGGSGVCA